MNYELRFILINFLLFSAAVQFCKGRYTNISLWLWLWLWLWLRQITVVIVGECRKDGRWFSRSSPVAWTIATRYCTTSPTACMNDCSQNRMQQPVL